ncbi:DUF302 domain-containing protein [Mucilaginibacter psychrotolerans]|uniref:DUF302 domain-containing protein n=1 Tax=Mucilaginibacter psychrotolerans TaxID=1524096 RepID=A0A4Y8S9Y0_9SPHI|nr:DUF302 domain-containing protein [Mucilaginibacter psychrotolerans]TFF35491.1 DUF302 domain-containing protein [Mucilaginibacter psychrotolerans]
MSLTDITTADAQGILIKECKLPVKETMDLIQRYAESHGATVYTRIDQQSEARKNGITLQPLEYLLFGNPQKGAALMASNPLIALDLPLKIICWQNQDGKTLIAFNDHEFISRRYGFETAADSPLNLVRFIDQVFF